MSADTGRESFDLAGQAEDLTTRFKGGISRLAANATRGAKRVKDAAQDLRGGPVLQQALAARERGNLEAAFWLLNEEFSHQPVAEVATHYWDVALSLGRVDIAADAGIALIESRAAMGEPELAAQHWLELVKEAPDVLVSPTAIATLLPALRQRHAEAQADGPDDKLTLAGYLRRAVRHAVDPRNTGLHPGVALRIFEHGREANPEAARRAAETALESPHLHEAKRERLEAWLAGKPIEERASPTPAAPTPAAPTPATDTSPNSGLSRNEIQTAAKRLPKAREARPEQGAPAHPPQTDAAPTTDSEEDCSATRVRQATLEAIEDEGLQLRGIEGGSLAWSEIQAVSVAEVMGLEETPVTFVDLVLNWSQRNSEPLEIVRLRVVDLDFAVLVTRKHALGSDFAALMGDILERTSAIPLPDPESALGTRITCFETPELYEQVGLRISPRD